MDEQYQLNCGLLRLFDEFNTQRDACVPRFQYHFDEDGLAALRDRYHLTQVAGGGDDWSRVLNLLHWLYGNTWHNGNTCPSIPKNALTLLDYSFGKGKEGGINCHMLASILTEACLSVGLPARIVYIFPLNPYDYDNHVVTAVWCREPGRWVAVDPSFNAYLIDADGNVIPPWDARDLLCRNQKVGCNAQLGYNGQPYEASEYLAYIAKNLFYMSSPIVNRFGTIDAERRDVMLIPKEFNVLKRELYNSLLRNHQPDSPWEEAEIAKARTDTSRRHERYVMTNSIASFAQPPEID